MYQGYLDERSTHHVKGWVRDLTYDARRVPVRVVTVAPSGAERVVAEIVADAHSDVLVQVGVGDGGYAFAVNFAAPLTLAERDALFVSPVGSKFRLAHAPEMKIVPPHVAGAQFQGYVDEFSIGHVAGWLRDVADPAPRFDVDIVLGDEVLASARAENFSDVLRQLGVGDGRYAFRVDLPRLLTEAERDAAFVRPAGAGHFRLGLAPEIKRAWPLIVRADVAPGMVVTMVRLAPYVAAQGLRVEAAALAAVIAQVPAGQRRLFTALFDPAQRVAPIVFEWLAKSVVGCVEIPVVSLNPEIFAAMRPGADFRYFREQFQAFREALKRAAPYTMLPKLRFVVAAGAGNAGEVPGIVQRLVTDWGAWRVDVVIEALPPAQELVLRDALSGYRPERVQILAAAPQSEMSVAADGTLALGGAPLCDVRAPDAVDLMVRALRDA